ncbi:hypothetical protein GON22_12690 [Paenibacillus sp. MMS18-CY102]|nr:hypothetical protein [Paenibacillus sp. MMS18-CY102]
MKELIQKAVSLGLGAAVASKEQAEKLVEELVSKGEVSKSESKQLVEELVRKGQETQVSIDARFKEYVRSALNEAHLTTRDEYVKLQQQVATLASRVAELEAALAQFQPSPSLDKAASGAPDAAAASTGEQ